MLNHRNTPNVKTEFHYQLQGIIIEAIEDIKRGEIVYYSYGEGPNFQFFRNYGFVNLGNEKNDSIGIKLERLVDKTDPFLAKKLQLANIEEGELNKYKFDVKSNLDDPQVLGFISICRLFAFGKEVEALPFIQNIGNIPPDSKENELKLWKMIQKTCKSMLEDYPETYDQDFEILKDEKLTSNQRNCVLYRQTEKRILKFYVDSAERIIPFFSMTFKDAKISLN